MLRLKKGPNQPGLIFSTLPIYFVHYFLINLSLPLGYPLHMPPIFLFSQLIFATPFHDSHSQLTLATPVRDSHSRLAVLRLPHCATPPLTDRLCQHPSIISLAFQP